MNRRRPGLRNDSRKVVKIDQIFAEIQSRHKVQVESPDHPAFIPVTVQSVSTAELVDEQKLTTHGRSLKIECWFMVRWTDHSISADSVRIIALARLSKTPPTKYLVPRLMYQGDDFRTKNLVEFEAEVQKLARDLGLESTGKGLVLDEIFSPEEQIRRIRIVFVGCQISSMGLTETITDTTCPVQMRHRVILCEPEDLLYQENEGTANYCRHTLELIAASSDTWTSKRLSSLLS